MSCTCGHGSHCHRYQITVRRNQGECLMAGCPCGEFEEST